MGLSQTSAKAFRIVRIALKSRLALWQSLVISKKRVFFENTTVVGDFVKIFLNFLDGQKSIGWSDARKCFPLGKCIVDKSVFGKRQVFRLP